jgi:signal transduction histidine kinase
MTLERSKINIKEICHSVVVMFRDKAAKRKIGLHFRPDDNVAGLPMFAEGRRIKQILYNLVDNAIKFTGPDGTVLVTASREEGKAGADNIRIVVEDTGIGISSEGLGKLFKPFSQLSGSYSEQSEGTGLGLVLTRHLIELHGGEIQVESEPGKGSRFIVLIPLQEKQV